MKFFWKRNKQAEEPMVEASEQEVSAAADAEATVAGSAVDGTVAASVDEQAVEGGKESKPDKKRFSGFQDFVISSGKLFKDLMAGDVLLSDMFQRSVIYIMLIFVLSLWYINNRFLYERDLRNLNKSKQELIDLKYRSLNISKNLMQAGRRTTILKSLEAQGSDLQEATSPIIIINE